MAKRDSTAKRPGASTGKGQARVAEGVVEGDCIAGMTAMPESCVDFVFADPPYNLQIKGGLERPDESVVDSVDDDWDKFESLEAYDCFTLNWLYAARRVMRPDATIAVAASYHNLFRIGAALQDLGFWILNDIVWIKPNPMPNFKGRRFTNAHETVVWAARSKQSRYVFNYDSMKAGNEDVQVRSDWHIPVCGGRERIRHADGRKAHPTQKPEALVTRLVMAATHPGDLVLDPFLGSGTTAAAAKRLGRRHVGFERDPGHAATARARVARVVPLPGPLSHPIPGRRSLPRVAFRFVIEAGLVKVGDTLHCGARRHAAIVRPDGTISTDHGEGSIHKMGAAALGSTSCNGWTFWHAERKGALVPIDAFRIAVRASLPPA